jgi:hypothetical protein
MKLKYIYTLLSLLLVLCFAPAYAQTKHSKKKPAKKTVVKKAIKKTAHKATAKKPAKPVTISNKQKATARRLCDAAANASADTVKNNRPDTTTGLSQEIVITTAYKPLLADAVKIRRNPDLEDKTPFKAPLSYTILDKRLELNSDIRQLDAMSMPAERDSVPPDNFARVGLGNLKTTYGEAYIDNGRDQALQAGAFIKHFANEGSLNKQDQSTNEINVFGKSVGNVNSINGNIDYKYNTNYFYGYDQSDISTYVDPAKQHFSILSAQGELLKNYIDTPNDFTYALKLKGYAYSDAFQARENNLVLSGFLNETINQFYAGLAASVDVATQKDSLYNYNNSLLRLNPYIKFQGDNYKIDAGINIVDQFGFNTGFNIFPAAKLEYQVIPKYVRLFVEAKGDVNRSSIMDFSTVNPFIGQDIQIKNSIDQLDVSAGLKGTLAPGLGFKGFIFRDEVKYLPLFVSDFGPAGNKFQVIYDNGRSRINGFHGELDYKASEDVDIYGQMDIKQYQLAQQAQPWNLPKFKLTAGTTLHITNQVDINGSLVFRGTTEDISYAEATDPASKQTPVTLNSFADLCGGVDYKAGRQFTVFVKVNNILDSQNQLWRYYPEYGFNIFGGVGYSF